MDYRSIFVAIAFLALVSILSNTSAEHQVAEPNVVDKPILLGPSSISSADGNQNVHFFKEKVYITEKSKLSGHGRRHFYKKLKTNPTMDCQNSRQCTKLKKRYERAATETSNVVFNEDSEDSETTTISNEDLKNVIARILAGDTNAATPAAGLPLKNETRSLIYEDLNFVNLGFDAFVDTSDSGDVASRAGDEATETNNASDTIYLTYPVSMIDEPPDLLSFPKRMGNDSSTTSTTTEYPDVEDDEDDLSEESNNNCSTSSEIKKEGKRVAQIKCEENMINIYNKLICPFQSGDIGGVYGGRDSMEGEFPHAGAVGWQKSPPEDNIYIYLCGSSLINTQYALTAAHCKAVNEHDRKNLSLISRRPQIVAFGSVKLDNDSKLVKAVIARFISHPNYKAPRKYNDIALIKFTQNVRLRKNIRPACIWTEGLPKHNEGNIIGWGETETGQPSIHLKSAMVPFIQRSECDTLMIPFRNRHWIDGIIETQFCAARQKGGVDTCLGDSGGPIQVHKPLPLHQDTMIAHVVGVTSFGASDYCAEKGKAGVYTNITSFLCWIEKEVWPEEHNSFCIN